MTPLQSTLHALAIVRAEAGALKARIDELEAPHKLALEKATGKLREQLRANQAADESLSSAASKQYLQLARDRAAAIAANPDEPPPTPQLVPGCGVKWLTGVMISDEQALPRFVLSPDKKLLKDALVAAVDVPGAALEQHPIFEFRKVKEPKEKEPTK